MHEQVAGCQARSRGARGRRAPGLPAAHLGLLGGGVGGQLVVEPPQRGVGAVAGEAQQVRRPRGSLPAGKARDLRGAGAEERSGARTLRRSALRRRRRNACEPPALQGRIAACCSGLGGSRCQAPGRPASGCSAAHGPGTPGPAHLELLHAQCLPLIRLLDLEQRPEGAGPPARLHSVEVLLEVRPAPRGGSVSGRLRGGGRGLGAALLRVVLGGPGGHRAQRQLQEILVEVGTAAHLRGGAAGSWWCGSSMRGVAERGGAWRGVRSAAGNGTQPGRRRRQNSSIAGRAWRSAPTRCWSAV